MLGGGSGQIERDRLDGDHTRGEITGSRLSALQRLTRSITTTEDLSRRVQIRPLSLSAIGRTSRKRRSFIVLFQDQALHFSCLVSTSTSPSLSRITVGKNSHSFWYMNLILVKIKY